MSDGWECIKKLNELETTLKKASGKITDRSYSEEAYTCETFIEEEALFKLETAKNLCRKELRELEDNLDKVHRRLMHL